MRCFVQGALIRGICDQTTIGIVHVADLGQGEISRSCTRRHHHVNQPPRGVKREVRMMAGLEHLDAANRLGDTRDYHAGTGRRTVDQWMIKQYFAQSMLH